MHHFKDFKSFADASINLSRPLTVLIGKNGKIVRVRQGYNPGDEKSIAADVAKALGG